MIEIIIKVQGNKVADSFTNEKTTLIENSLALRRLEEIKLNLLDLEYESDFETHEDL